MKIQDDLGGDPSRDAADLGASRPGVAAFMVKGLPLFRVDQVIHLSVADLMDLFAEGMPDAVPEKVDDPSGLLHCLSVLLTVFQLLPPDQAAHPHNGPGQRPAGFARSDDSPGQRAPRLENLVASHLQLFLQSRKNGLGSAEISHVILEGQLKDLIQEFLPIFHISLLIERISFNAFPNRDINLSRDLIEGVNRLKKSYRNPR